MKKYMCLLCGFVYDESEGYPDGDILPGTVWKDVPINWRCPDCGAIKTDFEIFKLLFCMFCIFISTSISVNLFFKVEIIKRNQY